MKRYVVFVIVLSLLLSGCGWMSGSYASVTPHHEQLSEVQSDSLSAANYSELRAVLVELTEAGAENAVINVSEFDRDEVEESMANAVRYITQILPIGAYAIDKVYYEIGTNGGQPAISVNISYIHGRSELRRIRQAADMEGVEDILNDALSDCEDSIVIYVEKYADLDLVQLTEDYAGENPDQVMEIPQLAVGVYPETGTRRVLELKFTYQNSREVLRSMQTQVNRVFSSAALYINQNGTQEQKFNQLFTFLTERFEYKYETSITPSYSLLCHGVGDAKSFATVYSSMCRKAGLDCSVVTGTKNGEAWYWNRIGIDGVYYHVDLIESRSIGQLTCWADEDMTGYVWDYSAYPTEGLQMQPSEPNE